jgi:GTP-binding protein
MSEPDLRFFDTARIFVQAGAGGNGIVHFHREKYVPRGGPDGGDGGHGGSIYLVADRHANTLYQFKYKRKFVAEPGKQGGTNRSSGKSATDLEVSAPLGTVAYDVATQTVIGELINANDRILLAQGGRGGAGNHHFATARHQSPYVAIKGDPGQEREIMLEMKLIAELGIIGVPNAGKSTFLASVTAARPKVADYPFTTIIPNLGVIDLGNYQTIVAADIPGLIEGAHLGVGLGFEFLRHIQRTRVLVHLLDGLAENPLIDFRQVLTELALFDADLLKKPQLVALNKMELPEVQAKWQTVRDSIQAQGYQIYPLSAATGKGTRELVQRAAALLQSAEPAPRFEPTPIYRPETDPNIFEVEKVSPGVFRLQGASIERAARLTYWEFDDSIRRFQRILERIGVQTALRAAGIEPGDMVQIGEYELAWIE